MNLSYTTLHDRLQISCHVEIQTGGTSVSNGSLNLVNGRIPSCLDNGFLTSVVVVLTNKKALLAWLGYLPSVPQDSSSHEVALGWLHGVPPLPLRCLVLSA